MKVLRRLVLSVLLLSSGSLMFSQYAENYLYEHTSFRDLSYTTGSLYGLDDYEYVYQDDSRDMYDNADLDQFRSLEAPFGSVIMMAGVNPEGNPKAGSRLLAASAIVPPSGDPLPENNLGHQLAVGFWPLSQWVWATYS